MRIAFPNLKYTLNKTDYFVLLPNGSEIWFGGLDDAERTEKILGNEYSSIWFNEVSQIDYSSAQIAITRLAEKNNLAKKIYYDMNPPEKTHWSYWLFERKMNPIDEAPLTDPDNYQSLLMNPIDNIENIDEDYIKLLESMPEKERNRFLYGLYTDVNDGVVYYAFDRDKHLKAVDRISGSMLIGMDFNVNPMSCVIAQVIDNVFVIHDEIYLENADTFKMTAELNKKNLTGSTVYPDSTGRNRKTSGQSDFQILIQAGFVIKSTHNPFVTDRINNVNRLFTAGRIVVNPKCKKLINDLEKVAWKNNKLDQSGENSMLTHISDALGYLTWNIEPFKAVAKQITSEKR
jgi:phage terminase large subunit